MMENEVIKSALEKVKAQKVNFGFMERFDVDENWEVMKALEEIQQYRAIGTVESLKNLPTICDSLAESSMKAEKLIEELKEYQAIGTIEEFKALKEADMRGANRAVDEFANYLHKIAKENNGLRLSSETRSWTHLCIFDYLEYFKNEQTCKEET